MSAAVALMLEGMPSPRDLRLHRAAGRVVVLAGSAVVDALMFVKGVG